MLWKLFGQGLRYVGSPLRRRWSDRRKLFFADRRRGDESDERLVLVVYDSGFDLSKLRLENVLNGLCFDAVPADLELCVDSAERVHALSLDVDFALVSGTVETAE